MPGPLDHPDADLGSAETVSPDPEQDELTPLINRTAPGHVKGVVDVSVLREAFAPWRSCVSANRARFRVHSLLGRGGQGLVFAVGDRDTGREIAVKTLRSDRDDERHVNRFIHEAQVTAQLAHPNIVPVHDLGVLADGTLYYSMKRVEGRSLEAVIEDQGGDPEQRFNHLQLVLKLCDAMAFAHARGVIHRDLKPANVMVGDYGEVLVLDWGLAKVLMRSDVESLRKRSVPGNRGDAHTTRHGTAVGTPAYMSPEQADGRSRMVEAPSDIYSLGVICYELLLGISPYHQVEDTDQLLAAVREGRWQRIDDRALQIPRPLVAVVHKAMALEPSARYQSASELAADLRRYLAGLSVSAYRETLDERLLRWIRRNRRPALSAVIVATIAIVAWSSSLAWQRSETARRVDDLHGEALAAEGANDLATSLGFYQRILELDHDDPAARAGAERVELKQQARMEAMAAERAAADQRRHAQQLVVEAQALIAGGSVEELRAASERYAQAGNLLPPRHALRQEITLARDQVQARLQDLAREQARSTADALLVSAAGHVGAGRWSHARADVLRATELVPADRRSRDLEAAIEDGIETARAVERSAGARRLLARADELRAAGQLDAAVSSVQAALEIDPRAETAARLSALIEERTAAAAKREQQQQERVADDLLASAAERSQEAEAWARAIADFETRREELERLATAGPTTDDQRSELLQLRQRIAGLERFRAAALAEIVGRLHAARQAASDHPPVLRALADYYRDRVLEAEARGRLAEAAAAAAQGAFADREGRHVEIFAARGTIRNRGRQVLELQPALEEDADDAPAAGLRLAPGGQATLAAGRYLVTSEDGIRCARRLGRGQVLDLILPPAPRLPDHLRYVAPGPIYGSDGRREQARVAGYALAAHELSCGEWLKFLNDPTIQRTLARRETAVANLMPRVRWNDEESLWQREDSVLGVPGRFRLVLPDDTPVDPAAPLIGVSYQDAAAYLAWRRQRDGIAWRLPTREEWILAAQGGDGRRFPWGDDPDLGRCYSQARSADRISFALRPGGSHSGDRAPSGIWDLAGSVSEWTASGWPAAATLQVHCGGSWADHDPARFTTTGSRGMDQRLVSSHTGLRLAVSIVDGGIERWAGGGD